MSGPLRGLRILDFTHVLAGPFATRVLGDMGADVVKINSASRALGANEPLHPYYVMWNRNKRALALDLSRQDAREIARRLCDRADVVIDNFSVGVLDRWGLGYDAVRKTNPGVVYVQMSGMGEGGPWSDFVTYAPTIHALTGLTYLTGVPGREDIGIGFSYNDHQAGLHAAVAVLAALTARRRTGRGQRIDLSQFEVGANFAGVSLLNYFANGIAAEPSANRHPHDPIAPHGCYRCADQDSGRTEDESWIAIACTTDAQWFAFRKLLGDPSWAMDPSFDTAAGRYQRAEQLDTQIGVWTRGQDATRLMWDCQRAGIPAGVVQNGVALAEKDPQLAATGFLHPIADPHPRIGQTWADRLPIHFAETPCEEYRRVRELGEDNEAVLRDWLGMPADEVRNREETGALR